MALLFGPSQMAENGGISRVHLVSIGWELGPIWGQLLRFHLLRNPRKQGVSGAQKNNPLGGGFGWCVVFRKSGW